MKPILFVSMALTAATIASPAWAKKPDSPPPPTPVIQWTDVTGSISLINPVTHLADGNDHISLNGHDFTFTATPGLELGFYNDNPPNSNPSTIATFIKGSGLFGLNAGTSLTLAKQDDSFSGGSFTSSTPFNNLAVHIGGGEMLFHWSNKITTFNLTGDSLSNYRAYAAPVPEPETYAMLIAGLGLVGFMARRPKQK